MTFLRSFLIAAAFFAVAPVVAPAEEPQKPARAAEAAICEHGVKATICSRCNPKLEPVFKARGDWCPEHGRPETQCVICHPELAAKGIK
jgi:hypothetical protein